jgi:hypothetical protein
MSAMKSTRHVETSLSKYDELFRAANAFTARCALASLMGGPFKWLIKAVFNPVYRASKSGFCVPAISAPAFCHSIGFCQAHKARVKVSISAIRTLDKL